MPYVVVSMQCNCGCEGPSTRPSLAVGPFESIEEAERALVTECKGVDAGRLTVVWMRPPKSHAEN